jgi:phospholipase C
MCVERYGRFIFALACLAVAGCSTSPGTALQGSVLPGTAARDADRLRCEQQQNATCIKHVVIIIQENRSFNDLFRKFPGASTKTIGMAGSLRVRLRPVKFEQSTRDISHCWEDAMASYDYGRMDGFYQESRERLNRAQCPSLRPPVGTGFYSGYTYVPNGAPKYVNQAGPYWNMARQYVLADQFYPTDFGPSFTAHQNLIAGTVEIDKNLSLVNYPGTLTKAGGMAFGPGPWSCDSEPDTKTSTINAQRVISQATGPFPCLTQYSTLANTLDFRHVGWQYYTPTQGGYEDGNYVWSPFAAIKSVREGPDWSNVITPQTKVLEAAEKGKLEGVTWVVPDGRDSDHPGPYATDQGPSWVASIVNAVGTGPQWSTSAVIILWDDWGGYYDGQKPPHRDFRGLGIRVPCIIISPYARKGYVSHTQYEFGSVLKFIENVFLLPPLVNYPGYGYTDLRANSLLDSFDFTQKPRAFERIPTKYPMSFFLHERPSGIPPDTE